MQKRSPFGFLYRESFLSGIPYIITDIFHKGKPFSKELTISSQFSYNPAAVSAEFAA